MSPSSFTMRLTVAESAKPPPAAAPPYSRVGEPLDERRPPPSRVRELLDEQRPRKMIDNMALIIMAQTFSALLEILGPQAPPSSGSGDRSDGHVQISRPVDAADPESPLLSVNASAAHCCISLTDTFYGGGGGGGPDYWNDATSPSSSQYRLSRTTITTSPGTLHLARAAAAAAAGGDDDGYWACADVRPDVASKGLVGVVETIKARLDAALRLEDALLRTARSGGGGGGGRSPKISEVVEARLALEKMRDAVDLDAIMRRHRGRRRRIHEEEEIITCRPGLDQSPCDAEVLAERLGALHVGRKRGCPAQETSCRRRLPEPDEAAEVLTKRLKALHV